MEAREERPVPTPGAILKVTWLDACFTFEVEAHPFPKIVTTVGYELPARFVPPAHIGIAAEWLGGDEYRAATYIPGSIVTLKEVIA